jgi:hypothetical protein
MKNRIGRKYNDIKVRENKELKIYQQYQLPHSLRMIYNFFQLTFSI